MRKHLLTAFLTVGAVAVATAHDVTVSLTSPQSGTTVSPGTPIDWSITFEVSNGDNAGLALLVTDLVQDETNPERFDLPYADGVPTALANFSRPEGVSNPGDGANSTGYLGSRHGAAGEQNLIQIGGGQNTFGQIPPNTTDIAQDVNVVGAIGKNGPEVLAQGSFTAPATSGTYVFRLQNARANVLEAVNPAPAFSPVLTATADVSGAEISFTVGVGTICADSNCDGNVTVSDINFFVTAVTSGEAGWNALFPGGSAPCDFITANDVNGNDAVSVADITPFAQAVTDGGCQ